MGVASLDLQQTDAGQGKIDYSNIVNKPKINGVTLDGNLTTEELNIIIPELVSELQNDVGYITKNVDDLVSYYDKTEIDNMISTIPKFSIRVVDELPTEDISPTTIYLLRVEGDDHFEEWVYIDDEWDKLGDGNIDLSDYATYDYVDGKLADKADIADLSAVAFSGRYADLTGSPVNLSQFTNDVGYLTEVPDGSVSRAKLSSALNADLTAVENAVDGLQNSVRDLSSTKADKTTVSALADTVALKADKSELPTKTSDLTNDSGFITSADVPTNVSELTNDSGYITSAALSPYSTTQQMNTAISAAVANKADRSEIPTKVSDLTNDSGFVNATQVNTALAAYTYPSQDLYTQSDIDTMLAQISSLKIEVVNALPATGSADTIYLLRVRQQGNDIYQEYFWVNNAWELIGGIDLTDYYTKTEVNTLLTAKADVSAIPTKTSDLTNDSNFAVDANYVHTDNNYTTAEKNKLAGIAAGAEVNVQSNWTQTNSSADDFIKNKPSIPTKTSDLTNDSGFITTAAIPTNVSAFTNDAGYLDEIPDDSVGLNQLDSTIVNALNNINNKANTADLAAVAFSGDYDDLTGKPTIPTRTSDLTNDSGFLSSIPIASSSVLGGIMVGSGLSISSGGVLSANGGGTADDVAWGHITGTMSDQTDLTNALASKANSADLATVATSGDYDDLTDKPTIGTGLLTLKNNDVVIGTFSANSTSARTITVTTPTKTSDLTNDSGFLTSYTETDPVYSVSPAAGITAADISSWDAKSDFSGSYNDLTDKPTIGNATLTIQKNGASAGTFTANATSNKTINITVPTTAADVSALPASTKYGASIEVSVNTTNYKVTTTLKDQDGNTLGTAQVIDLPLESVVVNGSYDSTNKKIVLTLQSGSTIDIPVADLVSGLQSEITSTNKLSSDLVDDTNHTHKFVTAAQITKLNGIAAGAEVNVQSDWNQTTTTADDYIKNKPSIPTKTSDLSNDSNFVSDANYVHTDNNYTTTEKNKLSGIAAGAEVNVQANWAQTTTTADDYIKNKPTIPTVNNGQLTIQKNGTNVATFTANQSGNATANITVPTKTSDITNDSDFTTTDVAQEFAIGQGSTNPVFDDMTPVKTIEWDVSDATYRPIYQMANTGWTYINMDVTVAYRITVTGTNIHSVTDVVDRWINPVSYPITSMMCRTLSNAAATTGLRYLRAVYPVSGYLNNTTYPLGTEIAMYNTTARHVKVEVFKDNSKVTWNTTRPSGPIYVSGTYNGYNTLTAYDTRGWRFRQPSQMYAQNAGYAGYISDFEPVNTSAGELKAGATALVAGHYAYLADDGLVYDISNKTKNIAMGESKIGFINSAVNANAAIGWTVWRAISRPNATQFGYFSHDTLALGDRVFLRCTMDSSGNVHSDNYLSKTMSAGYTWMPFGWARTATTLYVDTRFPMFYTLDSSGKLTHINGKQINAGSSITVDSALSDSSTNPVQNKVITNALGTKANASDMSTALAGKQNTLTAGAHINITGSTIKAVDYVHSDSPVSTSAVTPVVTNNMIANGTITADKLATGATLKLTLSTSDIGEGAALAANTLYGVYQ